jgi:hypothetical protein
MIGRAMGRNGSPSPDSVDSVTDSDLAAETSGMMATMNRAGTGAEDWVTVAAYENLKGRPHPAAAVRA